METVGEVFGRSEIEEFEFIARGKVGKSDYVIVNHEGEKVLAQVMEMYIDQAGRTLGRARVIGFVREEVLQLPRRPIRIGSKVYKAPKNTVIKTLKLNLDYKKGLFYGFLEKAEKVPIYLDVNKFVTRHVAVLAQSGAGKSYDVGVLIEELMEKDIPTVVIDPHGEYGSMKYPNDNEEEIKLMEIFGIEPKGYAEKIWELAPNLEIAPHADEKLTLRGYGLTLTEILGIMPFKLSGEQIGIIVDALKDLKGKYTLEDLRDKILESENNLKYEILPIFEELIKSKIFSKNPIPLNEIVKVGRATIINLRGITSWLQEVIVTRLLSELFNARIRGKIPPLFLILEEAHNFIPANKQALSSDIIKTIAGEGRKFGFGLCVVSQRPSKIDEDVLSQCGTKIIKRITNKTDLEAILASVEGLEPTFLDEIARLPPQQALVAGVITEVPLFVHVRIRKSKHGGATPDVLKEIEKLKQERE